MSFKSRLALDINSIKSTSELLVLKSSLVAKEIDKLTEDDLYQPFQSENISNIFSNCIFSFACSRAFELRKLVKEHGGQVLYSISEECSYVVYSKGTNIDIDIDRSSVQFVTEEFVLDCISKNELLDATDYLIEPPFSDKNIIENFSIDSIIDQMKASIISSQHPDSSSSTKSETEYFPHQSLNKNITYSFNENYIPQIKEKSLFSKTEDHDIIEEEPDNSDFEERTQIQPIQPIQPTQPIQPKSKQFEYENNEIDAELDKIIAPSALPVVHAYNSFDKNQPSFSKDCLLLKYDQFQVTDMKKNFNKYYSIEIHHDNKSSKLSSMYRIFTHFGRTDDLEKNKNAGRRQSRYFKNRRDALVCYKALIKQKISPPRCYQPVELSSSCIGSDKLRELIEKKSSQNQSNTSSVKLPGTYAVPPEVQQLTSYIFDEATYALTTALAANITNKGIETPIGVLSKSQVEKGRNILTSLQEAVSNNQTNKIEELTSLFYTTIPHRLGRARAQIQTQKLDNFNVIQQKFELLQLMSDLLSINFENSSLLGSIDMKYMALKCEITPVSSPQFSFLKNYIESSQKRDTSINVCKIFSINRLENNTSTPFKSNLSCKYLFHGSRISNWVGLLSRGLIFPKELVKLGGKRTNVGWLGSGVYFADSACTITRYATEGKKGTKFMFICKVALGETFDVNRISTDLRTPPLGYHSVHGVVNPTSDFDDDEYVVYSPDQLQIKYLVEFTSPSSKALPLPPNRKPGDGKDVPCSYTSTPISRLLDAEEIDRKLLSGFQKPASFVSNISTLPPLFSQEPKTVSTSFFEIKDKSEKPRLDSLFQAESKTNVSPWTTTSDTLEKPSISYRTPWNAAMSMVKPVVEPELIEYDDSSITTDPSRPHTLGSDQENAWIKKSEDWLRRLYATDRNHNTISDIHVMLINVYSKLDTFKYSRLTSKEAQIPKILDLNLRLNSSDSFRINEMPSVVSEKQFFENWNTFSQSQLDNLNWNNVFIAGGCVLACMMPLSPATSDGFKGSDIDMFLYGVSSQEANDKLVEIFNTVKANRIRAGQPEPNIVRTKHAITIIGHHPFRHIQIVLRVYKSPAEILIGFDIDACTVGFDGKHVFATPRARRALNKQYNLLDLSRRSLTYEVRLYKYSKRGFSVALPGFKPWAVLPEAYNEKKTLKECQGLQKLLVYDAKSRIQKSKDKPGSNGSHAKFTRWQSRTHIESDEFTQFRIEEQDAFNSDYENVFLPYGPRFYQWSILRHLRLKDKGNVFSHHKHKHIFFEGLDGILKGYSSWCKFCQQYKDSQTHSSHYSSIPSEFHSNQGENDSGTVEFGPLKWLVENPGRQLMTGSFHPLPPEHWEDDCYDPSLVSIPPSDPEDLVRWPPTRLGVLLDFSVPKAQKITKATSPKAQESFKAKGTSKISFSNYESVLIISTSNPPGFSSIINAFDLDDTLIKTKSGKIFATNSDDWEFKYPNVPEKLRRLNGKIVIFSNQLGLSNGRVSETQFISKIEKIAFALQGIPFQAFFAKRDDLYRKPRCGLEYVLSMNNGDSAIDPTQSIFVGDAAGRPNDFSSSDLLFSQSIGFKFFTPETFFLDKSPPTFGNLRISIDPSSLSSSCPMELVLLYGGPSFLNVTFYEKNFARTGHFFISSAVIDCKATELIHAAFLNKVPVVYDFGIGDNERRAKFIKLAKKFGVICRCFILNTSDDEAEICDKIYCIINNAARPRSLLQQMKKPVVSEGFDTVVDIPLKNCFRSLFEISLYNQFNSSKPKKQKNFCKQYTQL